MPGPGLASPMDTMHPAPQAVAEDGAHLQLARGVPHALVARLAVHGEAPRVGVQAVRPGRAAGVAQVL